MVISFLRQLVPALHPFRWALINGLCLCWSFNVLIQIFFYPHDPRNYDFVREHYYLYNLITCSVWVVEVMLDVVYYLGFLEVMDGGDGDVGDGGSGAANGVGTGKGIGHEGGVDGGGIPFAAVPTAISLAAPPPMHSKSIPFHPFRIMRQSSETNAWNTPHLPQQSITHSQQPQIPYCPQLPQYPQCPQIQQYHKHVQCPHLLPNIIPMPNHTQTNCAMKSIDPTNNTSLIEDDQDLLETKNRYQSTSSCFTCQSFPCYLFPPNCCLCHTKHQPLTFTRIVTTLFLNKEINQSHPYRRLSLFIELIIATYYLLDSMAMSAMELREIKREEEHMTFDVGFDVVVYFYITVRQFREFKDRRMRVRESMRDVEENNLMIQRDGIEGSNEITDKVRWRGCIGRKRDCGCCRLQV